MEWVIAILGVGCLFFAFQIAMDYIKYRKAIKPKLQRLEVAKQELKAKIEAARAELGRDRGQLDPIKEEVGRLEAEYWDLERQIQEERARDRPRPIRFR